MEIRVWLVPMGQFSWCGLLIALVAGPALGGTRVTLSLRDAAGTAVPGAAVYLEGDFADQALPPARVVVDQREKAFVPLVTVIRTGTEVTFPNSDTISHHVYSFSQPNAFELPLYRAGTRPSIRFHAPGVVALGCNIHDSMLGYVVVVETPYFGTTSELGSVTIADVAPGRYKVKIWSPRLDPVRAVAAGELTVGDAPESRPVTLAQHLRPAPAASRSLMNGDY